MTEFTKEEVGYMSEALRLAKQGCYTTHPNPRVGCVIVSDGDIVGKGWHQSYGGRHKIDASLFPQCHHLKQ